MKLYQEQLVVIKNEKSVLSIEAEEINELSVKIFTLKEENDILSRRVSELLDAAEHLEM